MVAGLLGAAALPAAIAVSELTDRFPLLEAFWAAPASAALGLVSLLLARRGRRRHERTLGRVGRRGTVRAGKLLGRLALAVGAAGGVAVAVYWYLEHVA